jgi:hypothetical protein
MGPWVGNAKKHETSVALSVTSPNLNETLLPWLAAPEMMPPLPVEITGVLAYPVSKQFVIQRGSISAQAGTGEFTGIVSVLGDSPSCVWQLANLGSRITTAVDADHGARTF